MIPKAEIKRIKSLYIKKYRLQEGLFVAEGHKTVGELLPYMDCKVLYAVSPQTLPFKTGQTPVLKISREELCRISNMECPQDVLAVFGIPRHALNAQNLKGRLSVALDGIRDSGNLGTIIRVADWFGVENIVCSSDTADAFNPKTVQASSGALARVRLYYVDDLAGFLSSCGMDAYATSLDGDNLYECEFSGEGIVVFGNEGNGISEAVKRVCNRKLLIPNYPQGRKTTESLNVGTAAAVTLAEIRRQHLVYGIQPNP